MDASQALESSNRIGEVVQYLIAFAIVLAIGIDTVICQQRWMLGSSFRYAPRLVMCPLLVA